MTGELNNEAQQVIARVQKLLALANNNPNEHEAASASAKAMELLAAYNLDMAVVGKTAKGSQRSDSKLKGGLYGWQRDLWKAVSELNFCMYWSIKGLKAGSTYEHRILGREENVISARMMAEYLQQTVERLAKEHGKLEFPGQSPFIRDLVAFREGMASRLVERLRELREERLAEDQRKQKEAEAASKHPAADSGTGLILQSVIHDEHDLNNDYLNDWEPGTSAQNRRDREARKVAAEAAFQEAVRKQEEYDLAHPEEAAERKRKEEEDSIEFWERIRKDGEKAEKRRAKNPPKERYRAMTAAEHRATMSTYHTGRRKANDIGLDSQIDHDETRRIK